MENTAFISEAIRYQKTASDQIFEILALYQSNSEALVQQTLDQCDWVPDISKESYLSWSENYQKTTTYLKTIVDTGFEQAELAFTPPVVEERSKNKPQPATKAKTAAASKVRSKKASADTGKAAAAPAKTAAVKASPQKTSRAKQNAGNPIKASAAKVNGQKTASPKPKAVAPSKTSAVNKAPQKATPSEKSATATAKPSVAAKTETKPAQPTKKGDVPNQMKQNTGNNQTKSTPQKVREASAATALNPAKITPTPTGSENS
ncbi:MAG: hypothetical protein GY702_12120 [Desulfobulbaceae bacterium]|nr:hypothetical protein [Desulfobulbaceae bacterium]